MSIDKSTMKIFFEGMQGNMLSGGYTSKIITTPMGPFKWNDVMELWENVNNGMVMNNMSFQDMMTMGYETLGGGADYIEVPDKSVVLSGNFGNINNVTEAKATKWASTTGPQDALANGTGVVISGINRSIQISLVSTITVQSFGAANITMRWAKSTTTGGGIAYTGPFTINNGDTLRIAGGFPNIGLPNSATGEISVRNQSDGNVVLTTIPWSYVI